MAKTKKSKNAAIIEKHNQDMALQFNPKEIARAVYRAVINWGEDDEVAISIAADTLAELGLRNSYIRPSAELVPNIPENQE